MTTLLRYQPKETIETRRYSSSSSNNSSPTILTKTYENFNGKHTDLHHDIHQNMNPHYEYLQSLYHDKQRELQYLRDIINTQLSTINTSYNAVNEVFYNTQRQTLLQWEQDATNELHSLKEKLDSYRHIYHPYSNEQNGSSKGTHSPLSDTSSSSSDDD